MTLDDLTSARPMLATTGEAPLNSTAYAYEPKYDGIRALIAVIPASGHGLPDVRLISRLGNDKTRQFPEIVEALQTWGRSLDRPVTLDGEIVALDGHGNPAGFQQLQGRIHLRAPNAAVRSETRMAFIAFDLLREGDTDLRPLPLRERRKALEGLLDGVRDERLRISDQVIGDGRALHDRAAEQGWEGLLAKRLDSPYKSGRRSPDWCKVKFVRRQTCVVGGWTDPRGSRPFFGALLLGVYDATHRLQYIGHTGGGFSDAELGRIWKRLHALRSSACPFSTIPRTNERPHWTKPQLVIEVKFTEWTADSKLRHPTYVGMRDDVRPRDVHREPDVTVDGDVRPRSHRTARSVPRSGPIRRPGAGPMDSEMTDAAEKGKRARVQTLSRAALRTLTEQLSAIEDGGGNGVLQLPDGDRLDVTNLRKVFWPALKLTKGELLRHYVTVAAAILPALADRPLVMKRYPNGVSAKPFYQHRAPETLPAGVRVESISTDTERREHLIGGNVKTLLYTAQLASISQDPWFSRVGSEGFIDHVAIDLDPPDGLPFGRVLDVARWVREELEALKAVGFPKTSGAGGLHVYVPMPAETPYGAGLLFCQIVATLVARKHPKVATVERSIAARGKRIYVDYLQNIRGKTLASAYSPRANDFAGVSTPLTWTDVDDGVTPQDFTVRNFAERLARVGDVWAKLRTAKGADLRSVMKLTADRP